MIELKLSEIRKMIFLGIITEADEETREKFLLEYGYDKVAYSRSHTHGTRTGVILREDSTGKFYAILGSGIANQY